jgi:membrane-bound lytic murein transglycosylase F
MPLARYLAAEEGHALRTGDLAQMQHRKRLRVLMLREQTGELGRRDIAMERELVAGFARQNGMVAEFIWVDAPGELPQALITGRGDVVIGDSPLDAGEEAGVDRTVALKQVRYLVVARSGERKIARKSDLYGLRAGLSAASPTWPLLDQMSAGHPAIVRVPTEDMTREEVFAQLSAGRFDFTVIESDGSEPVLGEHANLQVAMELTESQPVSWLVRAANEELRAALDHHLNKNRLALRAHDTATDDLDAIRKRGVLRVITRPDADDFFISKGEPAGFEYDLIREFCLREGLRLEVTVADSDEQMLAWLRDGVGDVVTARVDARLAEADAALASTRMYHYVAPVVIGRADSDAKVKGGGRVLVARDSVFAQMLERGAAGNVGVEFELVQTAPTRSIPELVDAVAAGEADYTVVEATRLKELARYRDDIRAIRSIRDTRPYRYTVRAANPALRAALDDYLKTEYGSDFYRAAQRRYFDNDDLFAIRGAGFDRLSPYDDVVKRYADRYGFDWRLIVAQMYEESRFKPGAVSSAGARGLMQVLPKTARAMGFRRLDKPEHGIHAGVKYLDRQRDRFEDTLAIADRTWFALAAYHAGYDRVQSARRRATRMGLDPNRWFGNVEKAMVEMSRKRSGRNAYRGGSVTASYVREVRARYESYLLMQPAAVLATL